MYRAGRADADVEFALSVASSAVEAYCGRRFAAASETVTISPRPNRTALLPDPPVSSVDLVEAWIPRDGQMTWVEIENFAFTSAGLIYDTSGFPGVSYDGLPTWPSLPHSLRVTYVSGYSDVPETVKIAVIKAAGEVLANPDRMSRKKVDDVEYGWFASLLSDGVVDRSLLSEYRLVELA